MIDINNKGYHQLLLFIMCIIYVYNNRKSDYNIYIILYY